MTEPMRCRGMRDILPEEMSRFRRIEDAFRDVCLGWGYEEVRTPTLEPLYLFTQAGTLSPQMLERVYSFLDWDGWSGERVVLRPDSTIPSVRLFVEQRGRDSPKFFYVQNVFRFEPGDASREDWQCGVEQIGAHPGGDVELILMALETLERLGLGTRLKLSDPGILRAILDRAGLNLTQQLALYDRVLDGDGGALEEVQAMIPDLGPSLGALLAGEGGGGEYVENLRTTLAGSIPGIAQPLDELAAASRVLSAIGIAHTIAPVLVRNFEYYTGPVFHVYCGEGKVGGGGRYDALVGLVGGAATPASGFALDINALVPLLADDGGPGLHTIQIRAGKANADLVAAFALARALRDAACPVTLADGGAGGQRVVVKAGEFLVSLNGGDPKRMANVEDVVHAVVSSLR